MGAATLSREIFLVCEEQSIRNLPPLGAPLFRPGCRFPVSWLWDTLLRYTFDAVECRCYHRWKQS